MHENPGAILFLIGGGMLVLVPDAWLIGLLVAGLGIVIMNVPGGDSH